MLKHGSHQLREVGSDLADLLKLVQDKDYGFTLFGAEFGRQLEQSFDRGIDVRL